MVAVVTGSTGLVGGHIISNIIADPKYTRLIVISRRDLDFQSQKIEIHICPDFKNLGAIKPGPQAHYFCALGTTIKKAGSPEAFRKIDFDSVIEIARWAQLNEAESFSYVSAQGANKNSKIFYSRIKGQVESELINFDFKHLLIYRPGLLMGHRAQDPRFLESMAQRFINLSAVVLPKQWLKHISTSANELASKMVRESCSAKSKVTIFESANI